MVVREIIPLVETVQVIGKEEAVFNSLCLSSKEVKSGSLFFAIKGSNSDGHGYINQAIDSGASVIICEVLPKKISEACTYLVVKNSQNSVGLIAHHFHGNPSHKLSVIGITGTNGKTTIATLLYELFTDMGHRCGLLSTNGNRILDLSLPTTHTTPDAISLNALLGEMVKANCSYCFMEVSSHAIHQNRIAGIRYLGGVFTNLTRDHLDYHVTFDNYLRVKKSFFDQLPKNAFALSNAEDKNGSVMLQNVKCASYTYATKGTADFKAKIIEKRIDGMLLEIQGHEVWVNLTGNFNAQNILAITFTSFLLDQDMDSILMGISKLTPVPGRMETFHNAENIYGIVDFAHTPDALSKVLELIQGVKKTNQKVFTVIGAGGNRDKGKRPMMTKEALKGSNKVILTSDNPRNEPVGDIIKNMLEGLDQDQLKQVLVIENREQAIRTAFSLCHTGDIFLVAGKGHEKYQEINGVKYPYSDQEVITTLFN